MIFDQLAGIVERHLPQYTQMMKRARIFRMSDWRDNQNKVKVDIDKETDMINFRLPFDTVAIEEAAERHSPSDRCIILNTINEEEMIFNFLICGKSGENNYIVASGNFKVLELSDPDLHWSEVCAVNEYQMWFGNKKDGIKLLASGKHYKYDKNIKDANEERRYEVLEEARKAREANDIAAIRKSITELQESSVQLNLASTLANCTLAVLAVVLINRPTNFIVEESLVDRRKSKMDIERTETRPHYIILKPGQIKKRFIRPNDPETEEEMTTRSVGAHERRGHNRRLQSDRYVNAKGKTIWIKAVWVGPSEAIINNNKYRVLLDK